MKPRVIFLVGPTASGKSAVALRLAKRLDGEIVSCDSMQVYRSMDLITSKPSTRQQRMVAHHLIDVVSVNREFDVSRYRRLALKTIKEIHSRNKLPLVVGGTGLYVSMVVDGIFEKKTESPSIRRALYRQAQRFGSCHLHAKLRKVDPRAAARIHPNDTRRIVRALEVFKTTGRTISELQATRKGLRDDYDVRIFCLDRTLKDLYSRIDARVEAMFRQGLVREVKKLLRGRLSRTARYAIGIPEVTSYLQGTLSLTEAKELMKKNTRNYARRQLTWFRKDKSIQWVRTAAQIMRELKRKNA